MVFRVYLDNQDPQESQENQVIWVFRVRVVLSVKLDREVSVVFQGREENLDQPVYKALKESLEPQALMGQRVALVLLEPLVTWVLQVFRECREKEGSLDLQVLKVTGGPLVRKDLKVHPEMMVQGVFLAH